MEKIGEMSGRFGSATSILAKMVTRKGKERIGKEANLKRDLKQIELFEIVILI